MKVAPCDQKVSGHSTSLLTSLNLQREQAQFCDCVVRQRQSPGQLYPAHRCVLAASSPVLASILSSSGALVELQAPCLSGSVLAILFDYIYTGALPCALSQQPYCNLLTAACYLQMDRLQVALCAWQQTEVNNQDEQNTSSRAENQAYENIINARSKTADTFNKCLPSMDTGRELRVEVSSRVEETDTCSVQSAAGSQDRTIVETCEETQVHSESVDLCIKEAETSTCLACSVSGAKQDASTLSESIGNTGDCREDTHLTPQALIQNNPSTSEGYGVSTVDKDMQTDQFPSAGTVQPESWQKSTEEELVRTVEVRRSSSSSPSSLQHPCSVAVPVICHSSRAAVLQRAEMSTAPFSHPVSRTLSNHSRALALPSTSTEKGSTVEDITTEHKNHYGTENVDYRNNRNNTETQRWDYENCSNQCDTQDSCYKSNTNQSDTLEEDYSCSTKDHLIKSDDEHVESGLSHMTEYNDHHAHCDSFHNKNQRKHFGDDSVPQNVKICSNFISGLKYKTDLTFKDLPSKHQRLDWSDYHGVSMLAPVKKPSQDLTVVVSLPVEDSETGSDSHCEEVCSEGEVKEEHSCSCKYSFEMEKHGLRCNLYGPKTDWSNKHEYDSDNRDTALEVKRHGADVCPPVSNTPESTFDSVTGCLSAFECHTSLDLEKISDTETSEPSFTFTTPVDSNMSESVYGAVGQSYHGYVHYHCLSQENTHLPHIDSHHKCSNPTYSDHSDQSSDEDGTFASAGPSPLREHFDTKAPEQVLLLDISTKHAELLVSYKHGTDEESKRVAFGQKDTSGTGIGHNDTQQKNEATLVARVDKTKIRARTKFGSKGFGTKNKPCVRETNFRERIFVGREQSSSGAEVKNKAKVVEVSKPKESENETSTVTGCSAPTVPESVQASMSSTFSVCIPPTSPVSMSANISAHLSTPVHHPFQCSLCDRSFSQRGSLNRHVRSHLGVRPFPCPCCPMTFSRQYRVTEHMRVHQRCTLGNDFPKPPASSV